MARKQFASSLVEGMEDGVAWAEIDLTILPLLFEMPCLKGKSPEEQQKWIKKHPRLAQTYVANKIQEQSPERSRRDRTKMAEKAVTSLSGKTPKEFADALKA